MKKAIITGVGGQDGSYLTELLLSKGYEVWGILRRHSLTELKASRLEAEGLLSNKNLHLVYGDITIQILILNEFRRFKLSGILQ